MSKFGEFLQGKHSSLFESGDDTDIFNLLEKKFQVSFKQGADVGDDEVVITADDIESAFQIAADALKVDVSKLQYRVIEKGSKGVFGFGTRPYRIAFSIYKGKSVGFKDLGLDTSELNIVGEEIESPNADGRVELDVNKRGKFLVVVPPRGDGKPVDLKAAREAIGASGENEVEDAVIQMLIDKNDGQPYRIGDWVPNAMNDGKVFLEISEDRMKAYIRIVGPKLNGRYIDADDIDKILREKKVIHGMLDGNILNALNKKIFNMPVLVAEGDPVKHGKDAEIDYKIEIKEKVDFENVSEDEQIDFHEMNLIVNVMQEEVLAEKNPAEKGENGRNVMGVDVPARDGKEVELKGGENTYVTEDGRFLKSMINGHAIMVHGLISIKPVYEVKGDVGPKTGNITNIGDVIVHGSVLDGYNVKAGGNIEIKGAVGSSILEATGDITIKLGINGKKKSTVTSKNGNLYSKYIQDTVVDVKHDVLVTEYIINSTVDTTGSVMLNGNKARIVGGRIRALNEVMAKTLGSAAGVTTTLEVGVLPEIRQGIEDIKAALEEDKEKLTAHNLDISTMEKQEMDEEKQAKLDELTTERDEIQKRLDENKEHLVELEESLVNSTVKGKITAQKNVFGNVIMKCNTGLLENKRDQGPSFYTVDEENTDYIKYNPLVKKRKK